MKYIMYHSGIKGMKWGIRRYQNKDGSLTPAGRKRYAKLEAEMNKLGGKKNISEGSNTVQSTKRKRASEMSDMELVNAINRARLEDTYNQLRPEPVKKPSAIKRIADEMIAPALADAGKNAAKKIVDKAVEKLTGDKVDPNSLEALKKTYEKLDYKQKIDKMLNPDKYLTEDEKTKRLDRQIKSEDRDAKMEGYADAVDKATKTRAAEDAAKQTKANEEAAAANTAKSKEYYNSTYQKSSSGITNDDYAPAEKTYVDRRTGNSIVTSSNTSSGKNYVNNNSILALPAPKSVNENTTTAVDDYLLSIGIRRV